MADLTLQQHMEYISDLETYSLILRPVQDGTEIIQYTRTDYSADAATQVFLEIDACLNHDATLQPLAATFVLVYLLDNSPLQTYLGNNSAGQDHWFVREPANPTNVFDFFATEKGAGDLPAIYSAATATTCPEPAARPSEAAFELLQIVQPAAQRYAVDERITPESKTNSEFLAHKRASDYLYQKGVFGKIR